MVGDDTGLDCAGGFLCNPCDFREVENKVQPRVMCQICCPADGEDRTKRFLNDSESTGKIFLVDFQKMQADKQNIAKMYAR